jgi:hypothetical protein
MCNRIEAGNAVDDLHRRILFVFAAGFSSQLKNVKAGPRSEATIFRHL